MFAVVGGLSSSVKQSHPVRNLCLCINLIHVMYGLSWCKRHADLPLPYHSVPQRSTKFQFLGPMIHHHLCRHRHPLLRRNLRRLRHHHLLLLYYSQTSQAALPIEQLQQQQEELLHHLYQLG